MEQKEEYILYGVGGEAERFVFCNSDILEKIKFGIDNNRKEFYKIPIYKLDEIELTRGANWSLLRQVMRKHTMK